MKRNKTVAVVYNDKECTKRIGRIGEQGGKFTAFRYGKKIGHKSDRVELEQHFADLIDNPIYVVDME